MYKEIRVLVIIPAFNEEKTIRKVIRQVKDAFSIVDIIVINDGSKDNTYKEALKENVYVINLPFNLGIGGAMQTGYLFAKNKNYDIAIQVDADGQHDPKFIEKLIEPLLADSSDMVIGSRYAQPSLYKSTFWRRLGIIYFANFITLLINQRLTDTTSGFRAVNKNVIDYFACCYPLDFPEVDVLIRLYNRRFRIIEIPVEMNTRAEGKSSIRSLKSIYYMVKVSLAIINSLLRAEKYS